MAHLGFLDGRDRPRVQPVTFAVWGAMVWSAVDAKPKRVSPERLARVRFLRRNGSAALTVDRYDEDWTRLAWLQLRGEATLVTDAAEQARAAAALLARYPQYAMLPLDDAPVIRITSRRVIEWAWPADG